MKNYHEQLIGLEDRCRKMVTIIKEKKKERQRLQNDQNVQNNDGQQNKYTQEELEKL